MRWLTLSAALTACFLAVTPGPRSLDFPGRLDGMRFAVAALRGDGPRSDFAADYVSARALGQGRGTAYPDFAESFAPAGVDWPIAGHNTHPPTAFLLAVPVAPLEWPAASAAWAWLALAGFAVTTWALGARLPVAFALAPAWLLWPPAAWSLGQMTVVWLTGAALAYRWRDRPRLSGAMIGLAALPKFAPLLLLAPSVRQRDWRVLAGCAAVWVIALIAVTALLPSALPDYLRTGRHATEQVIALATNASPWPRLFDSPLVLSIATAVAVAVLVGVRATWRWWEWAAVALLPIAWIYSLLPLAPLLLVALRGRAAPIAAVAVAAPWAIPPFTPDGFWITALCVLSAGLALALSSPRPSRRGGGS